MRPSFRLNTLSAALALALASMAIGAESAEELIQQGRCLLRQTAARRGAEVLSSGGKAGSEQRATAGAHRAAVSPSDERCHEARGEAAARHHGGGLRAARGGARAERSGGAARRGDQLRARLLPLQGTKEQIANSRLIKIAVDKVIALDPSNDLGLARPGPLVLSARR